MEVAVWANVAPFLYQSWPDHLSDQFSDISATAYPQIAVYNVN
jgi:hypothetical protein